jgi:hypothetical protein
LYLWYGSGLIHTMATLTERPAPTAARNIEQALAEYGEQGQRWLDAMWHGDPLADAVVADFGDGIGERSSLRAAIADGLESVADASASLTALFAALDDEPEWLDHDTCDRAAGHLARHHREYAFVLGAASLIAGAGNHIAGKPLLFTGRYASQAAVRSIEVGSWLIAVTTPGGLRRAGRGFEHTVRVRMIHAFVRARLNHDQRWDHAAWGLPIPQPYMAFTLAEFGSIALRAMHQLGVRYSDSELDDIFLLWRYVGRLVGMDEALNPSTAADHHRIERLYALTGGGADPDDAEFVTALAEFQTAEIARVLPGRASRVVAAQIVRGLQRAFVGDAAADALAIVDTPLKHLPTIVGPVSAAAYRTHDLLVPAGRERRTARGFSARAVEMERLRATYDVRHQLVDDAPA